MKRQSLHRGKCLLAKGFSLMEAVVVILLICALIAAADFAYKEVMNRKGDPAVRAVLTSLATAEQDWFSAHGTFATAANELAEMQSGYTFVEGATPSTSSAVVSVQSGTSGGGDSSVGIAILSNTGDCLSTVVFPPTTNIASTSGQFTPTSEFTCSGASAFTASNDN
jgi:Tfp pilus assembly protein PilE